MMSTFNDSLERGLDVIEYNKTGNDFFDGENDFNDVLLRSEDVEDLFGEEEEGNHEDNSESKSDEECKFKKQFAFMNAPLSDSIRT